MATATEDQTVDEQTEGQTEGQTEATVEPVKEKKARPKKPTLFEVGDTVITEQGEAQVIEVHGRGWVKVDGVPKAWHKIVDLRELNPAAVAKLEAAEAEMEKRRADRASGATTKLAKAEAKLATAEAKYMALGEAIATLKTEIEKLKAGEQVAPAE